MRSTIIPARPCLSRPLSPRRRSIARLAPLAAAGLLAGAGQASAQLTSFTITDGSAQLNVGSISTARTASFGGTASLTTSTGATQTDHLFQNWFWYRTSGDSREYALSNITGVSTASGNRARLVYSEPSNDGATPDALLVELEYTISDLTAGSTSPERVLVTIAFKIQNLTAGNLNVQLYSYNDMDLGGTIGGDSCTVGGADDQIQEISDPGAAPYRAARALYAASATNHINYQVGAFPTVRDILTDGVVSNYADSSPAFGPGDYSGGHQWGTTLAPAGSAQSSLVGSVTLEIQTNVCRADFDQNDAVNSNDISAFLTEWLGAVSGGCQ